MALHHLLLRQLRKAGIDPAAGAATPQAQQDLLAHVSRAYEEADKSHYLLERSQGLAAKEMAQLHQALQTSQARLASLLRLSSDWIWEQDSQGCFSFVSGFQEAHEDAGVGLLGKSPLLDAELSMEPDARAMLQSAAHGQQAFRDIVFGHGSGSQARYLRISGEPVFEAGQFKGFRGVGSDITSSKLAEMRIEHLARYDSLTGLPNRATLLEELNQALPKAQRSGRGLAVFFIDLDRFKPVNDQLGHAAGDELLRTLTTRLQTVMREGDMLSRIGGDEFVAVLQGVEGPGGGPLITQVAQRMLKAISQPVAIGSHTVQVTGSIGVACFPQDGDCAAALLRQADAAMYLAKQQGKNNFQRYAEQLAQLAAQGIALEQALRQAVQNGEFHLHYQPKFEVGSPRACGLEALLRWQHPERGLLLPADFIELAEETGLIVPIGRWVVQEVCRQMAAWREAGLRLVPCSLNVSARQFASDDLLRDLKEPLARYGIEPSLIEIEITESMLMAHPQHTARRLQQLRDEGLRVVIDDFGTGYSSLQYLKQFPTQTLKIDQSFVRGLPFDRSDAAIVRAVVAMAHSMGIRVVGEGVENATQLEFLRNQGCDEVQGFLMGKPVAAQEVQSWLLPAAEAVVS